VVTLTYDLIPMKKFINTLKNIWSIEELRTRILYTLGLLLVYRFGSAVLLPGVNASVMAESAKATNSSDLLSLINTFSGGAFSKGAVFALGVMPYITASIIVQLLGFAVPYFQRLQQHEGESGRKKLNQITRLLTVGITLIQGSGYLSYITSKNAVASNLSNGTFWFSGIIILSAGTIFAMWLGERITEKGIGNGTSFIIMSGIIDSLPESFILESQSKQIFVFIAEVIIWMLIILAIIMIIQAVRKIQIQFAKKMVGRSSLTAGDSTRDYIPLKLNAAGVMPIIFAQALMFLPATALQFLSTKDGQANSSAILNALNDFTSLPYNILYFLLVVIFTFVYTALIVNPTQYSEYLKRQNAFIPGVKPGENTASFIDSITTKVTLPGAVFLGIISILPGIAAAIGINSGFARFFGGTSILIMIGVILDTLQQIESHLLMKKYDGLVKTGKIAGRANEASMPQIGMNA
jgi:preprotein translocase subunit SecY